MHMAKPSVSTGRAPRGRPPAPKDERQNRLLEAAVHVFQQKGFHESRIEDIIAEAGIGKGTFYLHFKSKEEAFMALLDRFFGEVQETLDWVSANLKAGSSLGDLFQEEADRVFATLERHERTARLLFRDGRSAGPEVRKRIDLFYDQLLGSSKATLAAAQALGMLSPQLNAEVASVVIVGAIEKVYEFWLVGGVYSPDLQKDRARLARDTLLFLLRGCGLEVPLSGS